MTLYASFDGTVKEELNVRDEELIWRRGRNWCM